LTTINDELNTIEVGLSQAFKNITMFPLLRQGAAESDASPKFQRGEQSLSSSF